MNFLKKIILVLLFLFPISNSFAATTLTHVQTVDFDDGDQNQNRLISGIEFNKDGTKLFTSSAMLTPKDGGSSLNVAEFNLSIPYDISSRTYAGDSERCVMGTIPTSETVYDLELSHDGK